MNEKAAQYLRFVEGRHSIWEQRQTGDGSWRTDDPILATRKFTNVYRVLDYGSQYAIRNLMTGSSLEVLARLFLYRHTGSWEAWQSLSQLPLIDDLYSGQAYYEMNAFRSYGNVFTGAYMVFPQSQVPGTDKLRSIIDLTKRFVEGPALDFLMAETPAEQFKTLRSMKGVADFMSMQILTDWGYSAHCGEDRENDFVVAGPGSRRGCLDVHPERRPEDTIRYYRDALGDLGTVLLATPSGGLRPPSLMDVQNTFCEWSKYIRGPVKNTYQPQHPGKQPAPVLPNHW